MCEGLMRRPQTLLLVQAMFALHGAIYRGTQVQVRGHADASSLMKTWIHQTRRTPDKIIDFDEHEANTLQEVHLKGKCIKCQSSSCEEL